MVKATLNRCRRTVGFGPDAVFETKLRRLFLLLGTPVMMMMMMMMMMIMMMMMQTWHATLILNDNQNTVQIDNINIKQGIFQGDAFSPLWFTLAINPLSTLLNSTQYGFKMKDNRNTQYTISHMLYTYMDDL
jgi:hypothetical protein